MKAMMALFAVLISLPAQARCGDSLREVTQIINQNFKNLQPSEIAACFQGNWGYGLVIGMDTPLTFGGSRFEACPQSNGSLVLRKKGEATGGLLTCNGGRMQAVRFAGDLSAANGTWTKQGGSFASGAQAQR